MGKNVKKNANKHQQQTILQQNDVPNPLNTKMHHEIHEITSFEQDDGEKEKERESEVIPL